VIIPPDRQACRPCHIPLFRPAFLRTQAQAVSGFGRLEEGVQMSVGPHTRIAMRRDVTLRAKRFPEVCDQYLPFTIRGRSRKLDDSPDRHRGAQ